MQDQISTKKRGSPRAKGNGRPKSLEVKDHWISFRVTAAEYVLLLEKSARSGMSAGEYARSRAMRGIARTKKRASDDEASEIAHLFREVWHELRRIGVNINQIAHHCNTHQVPPPLELGPILTDLKSIMRRLMRP